MKKYRHIFFDFDNTLWDFDRNSSDTLQELYVKYDLPSLGIPPFEIFYGKYKERNAMMWEQYGMGKISKEELRDQRFPLTLWDLGLEANLLPRQFGEEYVMMGPRKSQLCPYVHDVLEYLRDKYQLHIITNGFSEVQLTKLESCNLSPYFKEIIISEHTGFKKPDPRIFEYAVSKTGGNPSVNLMIGDSIEADINGARAAGWDTVYFNRYNTKVTAEATFEISCLSALKDIL